MDEGDHQQGVEGLLREQAKKIAKRASESTSGRTQDDLERAMEKEVFTQLQDENMRLREELTKMQHLKVESGQQSEWSAVSEPPKREVDDALRFTPNGTRQATGKSSSKSWPHLMLHAVNCSVALVVPPRISMDCTHLDREITMNTISYEAFHVGWPTTCINKDLGWLSSRDVLVCCLNVSLNPHSK